MDDPIQQLENELKALRPRRPSVLLRALLEQELAGEHAHGTDAAPAPVIHTVFAAAPSRTTRVHRAWKMLRWPLAAAAVLALVFSLDLWRGSPRAEPAPSAPQAITAALAATASLSESAPVVAAVAPLAVASTTDAFRPIKAANVLYDLVDEGEVLLADNTTAQRVRARYVDTYTWQNPATNASLRWSIPRDEVRMIPARFH